MNDSELESAGSTNTPSIIKFGGFMFWFKFWIFFFIIVISKRVKLMTSNKPCRCFKSRQNKA